MAHAVIFGNGPSSPDQAVVQPLMIAFSVVQVDTLIPISLNREKYGTHGILCTVSG
jgi:hypothetical protein